MQNQHWNWPAKWTNTGFITEVLPSQQYSAVVNESRRITVRKYWFLQVILPVCCRSKQIAIVPPTNNNKTDTTSERQQKLNTPTPLPPTFPVLELRSTPHVKDIPTGIINDTHQKRLFHNQVIQSR